jgi:DNA integrity scanning protein DisA with diadenylate cyclase activity
MISGRLPAVRTVARALDLEGDRVAIEEVENVGTRHRSAYRLAGAVTDAVVIVISQDGGVRFVAHKDEHVTVWELE